MRKAKPFTEIFGKGALNKASRTTPGGWGRSRIGSKAMASGLKPRSKPITAKARTLGSLKSG